MQCPYVFISPILAVSICAKNPDQLMTNIMTMLIKCFVPSGSRPGFSIGLVTLVSQLSFVTDILHSEKKWSQKGASEELFWKMAPF